ncbi:hypothetical protein GG344DRAFT_28521, partial [Lentinula edodes]
YLRFKPGHSQYSTHCLKKIETSDLTRIPILKGYPIPRNDRDEQKEKYYVAMLTLFKPWSSNEKTPVKNDNQSWETAFHLWESSGGFKKHMRIIENMQLLYETKDAKFDYS